METLEEIKSRIESAVPGAQVAILPNDSPSAQRSLLIDPAHALAAARFLKEDPALQLDFASNVTGVDWPDAELKVKVKKLVDGVEKEVEEIQKRPGYLECVYHLYSMKLKQGPVIIRQRTLDRAEKVHVASLTPVWRGCEFQEREVYDLY